MPTEICLPPLRALIARDLLFRTCYLILLCMSHSGHGLEQWGILSFELTSNPSIMKALDPCHLCSAQRGQRSAVTHSQCKLQPHCQQWDPTSYLASGLNGPYFLRSCTSPIPLQQRGLLWRNWATPRWTEHCDWAIGVVLREGLEHCTLGHRKCVYRHPTQWSDSRLQRPLPVLP